MIENIVHRHMKTAAGKPYLSNMGLTKAKAMAGEAAMLYSIEAGSNKSKYYEMLIIVADDGTAQLIKANGRLGSQPRMGRPEQYRDLDSAKRALAKVKRSKINGRSAYKDAFDSKHHKTPDGKQLPKGQYPVGLATNPGSWRNQDDIQAMKPTLKRLVQKINEAVADADNADMNSVLDDLQAANALAMQLGRSSMAEEIKKKIKAPLARLQGGGRHRVDPIKVVREMKSLSRYISKQLSMTMTASIVSRASTKTAIKFPLDGARKHELMPGSLARKIPKLYSQDEVEDPIVYTKFFNPYGRGTWLVTEFDGRDECFGYAKITQGELGYFSLSQLANEHRNGLPLIERDLSWRPMPLSKAKGRMASTKTARVQQRDFALAIEKERRLNYSEETINSIAYAMSEWNDHRDPQDAEELNDYVDELMDDIRDNTHDGDEKIDLTQDERYLVKAFAKARRIRMASTKIADMPSFQWPLGAMSDEDSANIEAVMQRAVGRDYTVWRKTSVGATTDIVVSSPRMNWEDFAADFKGFLHDKIAKILKRFDKVKRVNVPAVQRLNAKLLAHVRAIKTAKTAKGVRWQGSHVIVDTDRMLSIKGVPKDEYGQVYDAALLPDSRNGVRMRKLVLQIVLENKSKIMRMRSPYEVTEFISKQTMALKGKTPNWHHYSMPD